MYTYTFKSGLVFFSKIKQNIFTACLVNSGNHSLRTHFNEVKPKIPNFAAKHRNREVPGGSKIEMCSMLHYFYVSIIYFPKGHAICYYDVPRNIELQGVKTVIFSPTKTLFTENIQ